MAIDANGNEVDLGTEGSRTITPIIGNPEPCYGHFYFFWGVFGNWNFP